MLKAIRHVYLMNQFNHKIAFLVALALFFKMENALEQLIAKKPQPIAQIASLDLHLQKKNVWIVAVTVNKLEVMEFASLVMMDIQW